MDSESRDRIRAVIARLADIPDNILLYTRYYCECGRWLPCRHCDPMDEGPDCGA